MYSEMSLLLNTQQTLSLFPRLQHKYIRSFVKFASNFSGWHGAKIESKLRSISRSQASSFCNKTQTAHNIKLKTVSWLVLLLFPGMPTYKTKITLKPVICVKNVCVYGFIVKK